jgi:hypothetical protein
VEHARAVQDPQAILPSLLHAARTHLRVGRAAEAATLAEEGVEIARQFPASSLALGIIAAELSALGVQETVRELVQQAPANRWRDAALAAAEDRLDDAADLFLEIGAITPSFETRHAHGRALVAAGQLPAAAEVLSDVVTFYRSQGATFFAEQAEALLAKAYSDSA